VTAWRRRPAVLGGALAALLWVGCAPATTEKGGLVRVHASPSALDAAHAPRRFAVLVGISEVRDPEWRPLRYAAKDAEDLGAALRDPRRGRFDQVRVLTRPEETTTQAVLAAVDALAALATRPDDEALLYVSAHGTLARDDRGELRRYLVTQDARLKDPARTALAVDALEAKFDALPSKRRVLVLATCHSGAGKSLLPPDVAEELAGIKGGFFARPVESVSRASIVLSASDFGETAREDSELQNDIYTHFLVEGLAGAADRNLDGAVVATEAHDYARRRTFEYTQGRQRPSAEILEVGADPVVLSGTLTGGGDAELFSYAARLEGARLTVDGIEKAELPGGAAVPPGRHRVQVEKGTQLLIAADVEVGRGARLAVDSLADRPPPGTGAISLGAGGFGFIDRQSREQLLPATAVGAVSLRLDRALGDDFSFFADVMGSGGRAQLQLGATSPVDFGYRAVLAGGALTRAWRLGPVSLFTGPRVAALWLGRSFNLALYQGSQDYLTLAPGWVGAVSWRVLGRLELQLQLSLMATYVRVDGAGSVLGHAGATAGAGWAF
jgi:hypothetical protein